MQETKLLSTKHTIKGVKCRLPAFCMAMLITEHKMQKKKKNDITKDPQTSTNEALCDKICLGEGQHNDIAQ